MEQLISLSRRASAFMTPRGVFYCLFETAFAAREAEPNPVTRCVAFGQYEQILAWIFRAMANCTNGMLRGLNGPIDPNDYWRFWAHALRRPDNQFDQPIWIKAGREAGASVPMQSDLSYHGNRVPFVVQQLEQSGYPDTALRVGRGEEVVMSLHRDADVLSRLYSAQQGCGLEPWRIVRPEGVGEGNPLLAPKARPTSRRLPGMRVYRQGDSGTVIALVGGFGSISGSRLEVLYDFISRIAPELEARHADAGLKGIAAFRKLLEGDLELAPANLKVTVNKSVLLEAVLFRRQLEDLTEAVGAKARHGHFSMTVPLGEVRKAGMERILASLPSSACSYEPARQRAAQKAAA